MSTGTLKKEHRASTTPANRNGMLHQGKGHSRPPRNKSQGQGVALLTPSSIGHFLKVF